MSMTRMEPTSIPGVTVPDNGPTGELICLTDSAMQVVKSMFLNEKPFVRMPPIMDSSKLFLACMECFRSIVIFRSPGRWESIGNYVISGKNVICIVICRRCWNRVYGRSAPLGEVVGKGLRMGASAVESTAMFRTATALSSGSLGLVVEKDSYKVMMLDTVKSTFRCGDTVMGLVKGSTLETLMITSAPVDFL